MTGSSRHVPLLPIPWDAGEAAKAIDEIVTDALARFGGGRFWPPHPNDNDISDGNSCVYFGAAGVIWGLDYVRRAGATQAGFDFRPVLPALLEESRAFMRAVGDMFGADYKEAGSLLIGDLGTALVIMRLSPGRAIAEAVHTRASANMHFPVRELMWGLRGSMPACIAMAGMTGEARWRALFEAQARRLLADLHDGRALNWWRSQDFLQVPMRAAC